MTETTKTASQERTDEQTGQRHPPASPYAARGSWTVRYGLMGLLGQFSYRGTEHFACHDRVIVRTERGLEIGEVLATTVRSWHWAMTVAPEHLEEYTRRSGPNYPLSVRGEVLRRASREDLEEEWHLKREAQQEARICEELIAEYALPMRLIQAEHLFGGDRVIFYFSADGRLDFRQLVRELAHRLHTRIEMRQIGARDEARLLGGYSRCGLECCCRTFLKLLRPVSMRMAKVQKATLDPTKISGQCGRLLCCLRYEDETYEELLARLPKMRSRVSTPEGPGTVIDLQILTQLVKVQLDSGPEKKHVFPVESLSPLEKPGKAREEDVEAMVQPTESEEEAEAPPIEEDEQEQLPAEAAPTAEAAARPAKAQAQQTEGSRGQKRRRRGKRRKRR